MVETTIVFLLTSADIFFGNSQGDDWLYPCSWWRHQMETFSALLAICAGNSPVPGEFSAQRPVTRSFDVYFDLRPNKRLSKQSWGWWFETPSSSLWCHRNVICVLPSLQFSKIRDTSLSWSHLGRDRVKHPSVMPTEAGSFINDLRDPWN